MTNSAFLISDFHMQAMIHICTHIHIQTNVIKFKEIKYSIEIHIYKDLYSKDVFYNIRL